MKLEPAVRALVAWWTSRGVGPLSIRVRLIERFDVDVPYEVLSAHIDDMRAEIDGVLPRPWLVALRLPRDTEMTDKRADDLEHEVRVRARIIEAWQSGRSGRDVELAIETAQLLGRNARFARRVIEERKRAPDIRGIRRRVSVIDDE